MATRLRFSTEVDLCLLKEVLCENPFENPENWKMIHERVVAFSGKEYTLRSLKDHLDLLLKLFSKEDKANLKKSGTEEQYEQKKQLLQEIIDLKRDFNTQRQRKQATLNNVFDKQKGIEQREQATANLEREASEEEITWIAAEEQTEERIEEYSVEYTLQTATEGDCGTSSELSETPIPASVLGPTKRQKKRAAATNATLTFLKEKQTKELLIKNKEINVENRRLALEERRLALDEQRFELEREERQRRLQCEVDDKEHQRAIQVQQNKIMEAMLTQLLNNQKN